MSNETINNMAASPAAAGSPQLPVPSSDRASSWRGMTLEELKQARGRALVRRELGRVAMHYDIDGVKTNVANNGMRALLFNSGTVSHLKAADYVLLGFKLTRWIMSMRNNRRRRRR